MVSLCGCGVVMLGLLMLSWGMPIRPVEHTTTHTTTHRNHERTKPCEQRVLVTGFEKFRNMTFENPSKAAAIALNGSCSDAYCVESVVLSVDEAGMRVAASRLRGIAAVLHLGYENSAKGLRLEVAAKNLKAGDDVPHRGVDVMCSDAQPAVPDAPCIEATTAPLDRMVLASLRANETTEIWSRDPGAFFCNQLYYTTLQTIRSNQMLVPEIRCGRHTEKVQPALIPAIFVHLPPLHELKLNKLLPILREIIDVMGRPARLYQHASELPLEEVGRRRLVM